MVSDRAMTMTFPEQVEQLRRRYRAGRKTPPPAVPPLEVLTPELAAAVVDAGGRERCESRLRDLWAYRPAVRMSIFATPPDRRSSYLSVEGAELVTTGEPTVLVVSHLGDQKLIPHYLRSTGARLAQFDVERADRERADRWYRTLRVDEPGSALEAMSVVARGELLVWQPDAPLPDRRRNGVEVEILGYRRRLNPTIAYIVQKTSARVVFAASFLRDPPTAGAEIVFRSVHQGDELQGWDPSELLAWLCEEAAQDIRDHVDQWRLWGFLEDERWSRGR